VESLSAVRPSGIMVALDFCRDGVRLAGLGSAVVGWEAQEQFDNLVGAPEVRLDLAARGSDQGGMGPPTRYC